MEYKIQLRVEANSVGDILSPTEFTVKTFDLSLANFV